MIGDRIESFESIGDSACQRFGDPDPNVENLVTADVETYSIGADYTFGNFTIGAGYESADVEGQAGG